MQDDPAGEPVAEIPSQPLEPPEVLRVYAGCSLHFQPNRPPVRGVGYQMMPRD